MPHGVDRPCILQSTQTVRSGLTVLFVGRQESRKGFDSAIEAALMVCSRNSDVHFRFIGVITGDKKCRDAIACGFSAYGSEVINRITIEGYLNDEELLKAYAECDIFLAPSRFESFGLIAIEAMRYGKPVIAGNVGGLAEVVIDNKTGILVNPDSAEDIAKAILVLCQDSELRQSLGKNAAKAYEHQFTVSHMIEGIEKAYVSFLEQRNTETQYTLRTN